MSIMKFKNLVEELIYSGRRKHRRVFPLLLLRFFQVETLFCCLYWGEWHEKCGTIFSRQSIPGIYQLNAFTKHSHVCRAFRDPTNWFWAYKRRLGRFSYQFVCPLIALNTHVSRYLYYCYPIIFAHVLISVRNTVGVLPRVHRSLFEIHTRLNQPLHLF